jgi:hypothetical protein
MAQFIAFQQGIEVDGEAVLAVVEGMGRFKSLAYEILADHGIRNPLPGQWYSQQSWLDAFQDISRRLGPASLLQIGKMIPQSARWPEGLEDIHQALASIDTAYHMNHRGGEIGTYHYEKTGARTGRMVCRNPFPCDFDQGIVLGVARRFCPADSALVEIPHRPKDPCRKRGDEECVYLLEW